LIFHLTVALIQCSGFVVVVFRLIPIRKILKFLLEIFRWRKFNQSEKILQVEFARVYGVCNAVFNNKKIEELTSDFIFAQQGLIIE
tara:strand:- start:715 stop:972 length:258 start_codon:yes stop_codon:yes gene_type:complete